VISGGPTGAAIMIHGAPAGMFARIGGGGGGGAFFFGGAVGKCGAISRNAISNRFMER
jgi:hypothetical protein